MDHDNAIQEILRLQQENLRVSNDIAARVTKLEETSSTQATDLARLDERMTRAERDAKEAKEKAEAAAKDSVSKTAVYVTSGAVSGAMTLAIALAALILKR